MATSALLGALAALCLWCFVLQSRIRVFKKRLKPINDAEAYARQAKKAADASISIAQQEGDKLVTEARHQSAQLQAQAESSLVNARKEADNIVAVAQEMRRQIEAQIDSLRQSARATNQELEILNEGLRLRSDDAHLLEVGYYEPVYGFEDLPKYQDALKEIKQRQKAMLQLTGEDGNINAAAYATQAITFNGSDVEGRKLIKKVLQLMLRAFNGECDSFIARVTYRNVESMSKRIRSSFDQINKLTATWSCQLSTSFLDNRLDELSLVYEYSELEQKIKEEQALIRQQEREEEKARREAEKRERDAALKEESVERAVREKQKEMDAAAESEKEALRQQIEALERQLEAAQEERKRAKSLAEQTKAGYVYILSNIGSFGPDIYKIGMTRREDPDDRRRELGDASVPFPFDYHAYIWTDDAPSLEHALHQYFRERRLNLENQRKEFFRISIEEIKDEVEQLKTSLGITADIRWTLLAEAKEYRLSEAKRKHLEASLQLPDAHPKPSQE
ncbi:DUF4041 domain-containing protein [Cyanobium sp. NIES-981]|uniref:DUF4041 domain-containing protein n=1 Tax=Cyanobium sp. NIES-981 TaxID=1851505 RepID=UPI0012FCA482|nr:DUF4041 domain-containing protein [Cyanobium sp. NIES-981]